MTTEVKGLVLRSVDCKESDRMLTIYTFDRGIISAYARGARRLKSKKMSATMQFCYASFILEERGEHIWVKETELIESFFSIRNTIEGLALASYIVEVIAECGTTDADSELLRLALNSLYAITTERYTAAKIKAAFEIRCAAIIGFMPDILACCECGEREGDFFFDIMGGVIQCHKCHRKAEGEHRALHDPHEASILTILSEGAKIALGYCIFTPLEKLFSFKLAEEDMRFFCHACESYLLNHLGRSFNSLDFYNEVKREK